MAVFGMKLNTADEYTGTPSAPVLGTPVASYDFEAGAQGWTTGGTPTWQRGTPGHGSGTSEAATGNAFAISGPTGYVDNMDATLTSPKIGLPKGRAVVRFSAKLDTEPLDPVVVEWSSNGSTWKAIGSYGGTNEAKKAWRDIWGSGQGIGAVTKVETIADRVDRLEAEYRAAKAELIAKMK